MIKKTNQFVKNNLFWLIIITIIIGFIVGPGMTKSTMKTLKSLLIPASFIMLWASMVTMKMQHFAKAFKKPKELLIGLTMSLIVAPLLMWIVALVFAKNPHINAGLVLAGLVPPGGFVTYWSMMLGANMGLSVSLEFTALVAALFMIPWGMKLLVGGKVPVQTGVLFHKILILVVGPFILAWLTRVLIVRTQGEEKLKKDWAPVFSLISSLMALYLVFTGISVKAVFLLKTWHTLILPIVGALTYYIVAYPVAYLILHKILRLPMFDAVPLIYGTATKNLSIAMGLAAAAFGPLALLGVVTCMIFQMPLASIWHNKFARMDMTMIEAPLTKTENQEKKKEKEPILK